MNSRLEKIAGQFASSLGIDIDKVEVAELSDKIILSAGSKIRVLSRSSCKSCGCGCGCDGSPVAAKNVQAQHYSFDSIHPEVLQAIHKHVMEITNDPRLANRVNDVIEDVIVGKNIAPKDFYSLINDINAQISLLFSEEFPDHETLTQYDITDAIEEELQVLKENFDIFAKSKKRQVEAQSHPELVEEVRRRTMEIMGNKMEADGLAHMVQILFDKGITDYESVMQELDEYIESYLEYSGQSDLYAQMHDAIADVMSVLRADFDIFAKSSKQIKTAQWQTHKDMPQTAIQDDYDPDMQTFESGDRVIIDTEIGNELAGKGGIIESEAGGGFFGSSKYNVRFDDRVVAVDKHWLVKASDNRLLKQSQSIWNWGDKGPYNPTPPVNTVVDVSELKPGDIVWHPDGYRLPVRSVEYDQLEEQYLIEWDMHSSYENDNIHRAMPGAKFRVVVNKPLP